VFEPHAVVLAEEPQLVSSLWTQRLRWSRGNVDVTRRYSKIWFRPSLAHRIGSFSFGLVWFSSFLLPIAMVLSSIGLVGLYFLHAAVAAIAFRVLWSAVAFTYIYSMSFAVQLDSRTGRRSWREALLFPGFISLVVMIAAVFPGLLEHRVPAMLGVAVNPVFLEISTLFLYVWMSLGMLGAWLAKVVEKTWIGPFLTPFLVYLVGFSSLLRAITVHSYIKELRHADASWDKTEKIGRVA
jgi:cellulose synthase/poly-beta-1,6-N-acetylglucosamine synthase-like glycosyltransferase